MILQEYLKNNSYQALLVTNLTNIRYFTGFTGSNATLLILEDRVVIFTDFRYQEQIRSELKIEAEIQISGDETLTEFMKKHLNTMDKIAVEAEYVTARQMEKYRQILPFRQNRTIRLRFWCLYSALRCRSGHRACVSSAR